MIGYFQVRAFEQFCDEGGLWADVCEGGPFLFRVGFVGWLVRLG
jgi:hypothetical protein